ncbi:MAG: hypothetical protein V1870_05305 [Candidatus Aenigmatarchaeota archaeon]
MKKFIVIFVLISVLFSSIGSAYYFYYGSYTTNDNGYQGIFYSNYPSYSYGYYPSYYGYRSPTYFTYYDTYTGYYQGSGYNGYYGSNSYDAYSTYPSFTYTGSTNYGSVSDYQYNDPIIPSSGQNIQYCQEPYGYDGDTKVMGINGKGEFRCTGGNWVLTRTVSELTPSVQKSDISKREYYNIK